MAEHVLSASAPTGAPIVVLKFGSSVLRSTADLPSVVHAIYQHVRAGRRVVAVVSAIGDTTDRLLAQARELGAGHERATAALLATGEAQSVALLTLALARAGVSVHAADPHGLGLLTRGAVLDAEPIAVDVAAVVRRLGERPVLVVPGFVGVDAEGHLTLLGRGGSDLTAVFLAVALRAADCVLCKDVDGLYDRDPAVSPGTARRFVEASYHDALAHGGKLVQSKAIAAARAAGVTLTIASLGREGGTRVGPGASRLAATAPSRAPLRVGLLGFGTVGAGVCERVRRLPAHFVVSGIAVGDVDKVRADPVPPALLRRTPSEVAADCDVLVDATGDPRLVATLRDALARGVHVVSANKAILARHLPDLRAAAAAGGARLLCSASVGGAVPMLASLHRLRAIGVVRVDAILNTTTNWVLAALARGSTLGAALASAREAGFAERDATRDLDGSDAADKLVLLADAAFGTALAWDGIVRADARAIDAEHCTAAARLGRALRVVASLRRDAHGIAGAIGPRELAPGDPLFGTRDADNCLVVHTADGAVHAFSGGGAGRWPTTEAVVGDLLALASEDLVATAVEEVA